MNARHIFLMLAAALVLLGLPCCSDNYDKELMPTVGDRVLKVDGHDTAFNLSFNASPSTNEVKVESNTLWKVEVVCEGGWCSTDKVSGRGSEAFSLILRDNMIAERKCSVTVYMVDAEGNKLEGVPGSSLTITVTQAVSAVRLDPSSLPPFAPQDNQRELFRVIANVPWTLDVTYEGENATEFITITPESGSMARAEGGAFEGENEATFYVSVADNRTAADRKAYINLRSGVGSYSVEISQIKSEYSFDVSPAENQVVAAEGGSIAFGVLSIVGWSVDSSADWVTFSVPSYPEGSGSRVETVATVAPNTTGQERSALLRFKPADGRYQELSVYVTQRAYDMTFAISSPDASEVVMEGGGTLSFDLDSRFDWTLETPSWVSASMAEGAASTSSRGIALEVAYNSTNSNRTGTVTVYPQATPFAGGVTLDPAALGIEPLRFSVTQFGGREPAISVPWLRDGYTQTSATVEFNFYSPYYRIVEAGLEYRREDASSVATMTVNPSDPTEGTASFELTGLDPASRYVTRGYVKDDSGTVKYGDWSYPFTTAGQYPTNDDNPRPEI